MRACATLPPSHQAGSYSYGVTGSDQSVVEMRRYTCQIYIALAEGGPSAGGRPVQRCSEFLGRDRCRVHGHALRGVGEEIDSLPVQRTKLIIERDTHRVAPCGAARS